VRRGEMMKRPWAQAPRRAAKKRDERMSVVFASGQLGKRASQFQEPSGRCVLFPWKTCAAG
jgi:hypothetical protein